MLPMVLLCLSVNPSVAVLRVHSAIMQAIAQPPASQPHALPRRARPNPGRRPLSPQDRERRQMRHLQRLERTLNKEERWENAELRSIRRERQIDRAGPTTLSGVGAQSGLKGVPPAPVPVETPNPEDRLRQELKDRNITLPEPVPVPVPVAPGDKERLQNIERELGNVGHPVHDPGLKEDQLNEAKQISDRLIKELQELLRESNEAIKESIRP